jgi:putative ABC transport system permease protein
MHRTEARVTVIVSIFSGIAIFIACLGLLGLSAFSASQRAKETSIRKVLGASTSQIALLLSTGYARLLILSFVIAVPSCYYIVQYWLEGFAYRIEPGPVPFLLAITTVILVAAVTVGYQSLKASMTNPVDVLRNQ